MKIDNLPNEIILNKEIKEEIRNLEKKYLNYIKNFLNLDKNFQNIFLNTLKIYEVIESNKLEENNSEFNSIFMIYKQKCSTSLDETIKSLLESKGIISEEQIKKLHYGLMSGTTDKNKLPGEYRDHMVWIGNPKESIENAFHIPPMSDELDKYMKDFVSYYNDNTNKKDLINHPFIKSAIVHIALINIHPFLDGNGRCSRMLQALKLWELSNQNFGFETPSPTLYLSKVMNLYKVDYFRKENSLHNIQNNENWNNWFQFNLTRIDEALNFSEGNLKKVYKNYKSIDIK